LKKIFQLIIILGCILSLASGQQTVIHYLSGTDKDHTVSRDFMITKGQHSGTWSKIPVPSNWELQGFGTYNYYTDASNPDEKGLYKYHFSDFAVYTEMEHIFLQMLKPEKQHAASNDNTSPLFPEGNIGFMHGISAIGTKFQSAEVMGPESQKNRQLNYNPLKGTLWFDFRSK